MGDIILKTLVNTDVDDDNVLGIFPSLMQVVDTHIQIQFDSGRISGVDYANVYLGALQSAISESANILLGLDLANAKIDLTESQIALSNQQIENSIEEEKLIIAKRQSEEANIKDIVDGDLVIGVIGKQKDLIDKQILKSVADADLVDEKRFTEEANLKEDVNGFPVAGVIGQQKLLIKEQVLQVKATITKIGSESDLLIQKETTELAQTTGTVIGGVSSNGGTVGRQQELIAAQTDGFTKNAEEKVLRTILNHYAIKKSSDPGGNVDINNLNNIGIGNVAEKVVNNVLGAGVLDPST